MYLHRNCDNAAAPAVYTFTMRKLAPLAALVALLALPALADGRQIVISPSSPSSNGAITATSTFALQCFGVQPVTAVTGNLVQTTFNNGCATFAAVASAPHGAEFGPLSPGTYTYELYETHLDGTRPLVGSTSFQVAAPVASPVPTIPRYGLVLLACLLAAAGTFVMRHFA